MKPPIPLAVVLVLVAGGCAAEPRATTPAAVPEGVTTAAEGTGDTSTCVVRNSFAPSRVKPSGILARTLVAGVDLSDPAMSHWNATTRQFEGFNIDLLLAVAHAMWPHDDPRSKITFRVVPSGTAALAWLDPTSDQHVDVVATSISATCERAALAYFSDDYLDSGQTALVRRAPGIGTIVDRPEYAGMEELGGRRVCAGAGTTALAGLRDYRTAGGRGVIVVQAEHPIDCLVMLRQGQVDAVSDDENILLGFAQMAPDTTLVTRPPRQQQCVYNRAFPCTWFTDEPHAFAFARGDSALTAYVNYVLGTLRGSGAWDRAHERWLDLHPDRGMPVPGPPVTEWPW